MPVCTFVLCVHVPVFVVCVPVFCVCARPCLCVYVCLDFMCAKKYHLKLLKHLKQEIEEEGSIEET